MKKRMTCILCPNGCELVVHSENNRFLGVTGNICKRGIDWSREEIEDPRRNIASSIKVENGTHRMLSVKTDRPVPLCDIYRAVHELKKTTITAPVNIGDVILHNPGGVQTNFIATRKIPEAK